MSDFWENIKRVAEAHRKRCETNPVLRESMERSRKKSECSATHESWVQDSDVHGDLDSYCGRCGTWDVHYHPQFDYRESFMTCDEILAEKGK